MSSATSALWYLGGAQTPVALNLAAAQGVVIQNPFDTYFKGAVIPSLILVAVIPAAVYLLLPPGVKSTPAAPRAARERLRQRGRPGWREVTMGCTLLGAVALWVRRGGGGLAGRGPRLAVCVWGRCLRCRRSIMLRFQEAPAAFNSTLPTNHKMPMPG